MNADLERQVFIRLLLGYRKAGRLLRVKKALYGLRELPLLWQKGLRGTLKEIGFITVPYEPYYIIWARIIIFYYINDIAIAFRKELRETIANIIRRL